MAISTAARPKLKETIRPRPSKTRLSPMAKHDPQRLRAGHQPAGNTHRHQAAQCETLRRGQMRVVRVPVAVIVGVRVMWQHYR